MNESELSDLLGVSEFDALQAIIEIMEELANDNNT